MSDEIVIRILTQVRDDVTSLAKSVARNNAKVISNGVKLDNVLSYNAKCNRRLGDLEEWKAGHVGFAAGKSRKASLFGSNVTLICTVGAVLIALAGFWFSIVSPALTVNADTVKAIKDQLAALDSEKH